MLVNSLLLVLSFVCLLLLLILVVDCDCVSDDVGMFMIECRSAVCTNGTILSESAKNDIAESNTSCEDSRDPESIQSEYSLYSARKIDYLIEKGKKVLIYLFVK